MCSYHTICSNCRCSLQVVYSIYIYLLFPDAKCLSDEDKKRLRGCAPLIIDNLDPNAVIQNLKACKAIDLHQYEDIKAERARWRQVEKICDFVSVGSQYTF